MMKRNATDWHVFVRVVRQIKVSNDCFQHLEDVRKIGDLVSFLFHQCINVINVLKFLSGKYSHFTNFPAGTMNTRPFLCQEVYLSGVLFQ